jgi:hypothetical protein
VRNWDLAPAMGNQDPAPAMNLRRSDGGDGDGEQYDRYSHRCGGGLGMRDENGSAQGF